LAVPAAAGFSGHGRLELPGLAKARQCRRKPEVAPRGNVVSTKEMNEAIPGEFKKMVG
jgi:hypothetical protein